jgi:anti-sigma regulatory factor (Ser/Thr protein kinase)
MCWQLERVLPGDQMAPAAARSIVETELLQRLDAARNPVVDDAVLVVSELVTNAVLAGSKSVKVAIELHHAELKIEVIDDADGWPEPRAATATDSTGRGLGIVAAVTERWGVERVATGKSVWARLRLSTNFTVPSNCNQPTAAG